MQSQLPASLGKPKSLHNLNLMYNNLWGSIPDFIRNLPSLRTLDHSPNNMKSSITKYGTTLSANFSRFVCFRAYI
ncbi:unnamed protein product [Malus baccata var. baccata]